MNYKLPITYEQGIELLKKYNEPGDMNHYLESGAVMKQLAEHLKLPAEQVNYWQMLGLLHDIDWGLTKNEVNTHLTKAPELLKEAGFDSDFIETVLSHGYGFEELPHLKGKQRTEKIQHALAASETITGLIHAYALMRGNKISDMEAKGLKKKFKDKAFAAKVERGIIEEIQDLGINLEDFFKVAIEGIKNIKEKVGLE